jgi:hypothetical protein
LFSCDGEGGVSFEAVDGGQATVLRFSGQSETNRRSPQFCPNGMTPFAIIYATTPAGGFCFGFAKF